ncbi:MAG: phosphoglycerate kinase [Acidilobaceae archaeon]
MLNFNDLRIATLDDVDVRGRRVLLRVDFNSPVNPETGELIDDTRIKSHRETMLELIEKEAMVVVLSHQGRPFDKDFISLRQHSYVLSKVLNHEVKFVEDICFDSAIKAIKNMKSGEVLVLENVRLLAEENIEGTPEQHAKSYLVAKLAPLFSLYINDAFSACHRSQASLVGFPLRLLGVAGRLLEKEVRALARALETGARPRALVVGGSKVDDVLKSVDKALVRGVVDLVLTTGVIALTFLASKGQIPPDIVPKQARDEKLLVLAKKILSEHKDKILTPIDFVVEESSQVSAKHIEKLTTPPKDIGPETVESYGRALERAGLIVMKGPAGVIEDPRFRRGTEELVIRALKSNAFTIFGGGHLISIVEQMPEDLRKRVGHLSVAGGALLYGLAGERLPCLEALSRSASLFGLNST